MDLCWHGEPMDKLCGECELMLNSPREILAYVLEQGWFAKAVPIYRVLRDYLSFFYGYGGKGALQIFKYEQLTLPPPLRLKTRARPNRKTRKRNGQINVLEENANCRLVRFQRFECHRCHQAFEVKGGTVYMHEWCDACIDNVEAD